MTVFGYARKDYPSQIAIQLHTLMTYDCEKIYVENHSFDEEIEWGQMLVELKKGDTLVVDSLTVFGKRLKALTDLLTRLKDQGIRLISVNESLNSDDHYSFIDIASILWRVDSDCQSQYTKERLAHIKSTGKHLGRPTINQQTIDQIIQLHHQHKLNYREISEQCGVSLGSVHKYIQNNVKR